MIQAGGIFMASKVKKKQNLQGLTEQQKHIIKYCKSIFAFSEKHIVYCRQNMMKKPANTPCIQYRNIVKYC